jgi:osmotically inducible protein OsmC
MSSASGTLKNAPFSFVSRFDDKPGSNPEELIAAAHAGCFSMALANYLDTKGYAPKVITTKATITLEGGRITRMLLETEGRIDGLDDNEQFKRLASEAEKKCPVSNLLRDGLEISLEASLKN